MKPTIDDLLIAADAAEKAGMPRESERLLFEASQQERRESLSIPCTEYFHNGNNIEAFSEETAGNIPILTLESGDLNLDWLVTILNHESEFRISIIDFDIPRSERRVWTTNGNHVSTIDGKTVICLQTPFPNLRHILNKWGV